MKFHSPNEKYSLFGLILMKFWRNFWTFLQIMLEFEEKYGQFAKIRKIPQKIWKKSGTGEKIHFSFPLK